jgi:hypothetical protein
MRLVLTCLALIASEPANALSCLRPDAVRLFEKVRDAEARYFIVKGRITFLEPPNTPPRGSKRPALTAARIDGVALNRTGFTTPFSRDVTISATCLGPWCGSLEDLSKTAIIAIRASGEDLVLDIGPCGGDRIAWSQSGEDRLMECHIDGICRVPEK